MQNFLEKLMEKSFESGKINGAVVMSAGDDGYNYTFFPRFKDIVNIKPFHPVMKMNGAKIVSNITKDNETNQKILFCMKPCEIRAANELKKLNQVNSNNMIFISYTCPGVLEFKEGNNFNNDDEFYNEFIKGDLNENIRDVCKSCIDFCGEGADISLNLFNKSVVVLTERGKEFLNDLGFSFSESFDSNGAMERINSLRKDNKESLVKELKKYFNSEDKVVEYFDKCIGCHACSNVCPICYCRQCYFESDTFKYYPDSVNRKLNAKQALRLPLDRVMFHLGRVTHMALSCVACGMCEDVCPVNIKVSQFFKYMGNNIQNTFNYVPGINREEPLPLLTFKEEEFKEFED